MGRQRLSILMIYLLDVGNERIFWFGAFGAAQVLVVGRAVVFFPEQVIDGDLATISSLLGGERHTHLVIS